MPSTKVPFRSVSLKGELKVRQVCFIVTQTLSRCIVRHAANCQVVVKWDINSGVVHSHKLTSLIVLIIKPCFPLQPSNFGITYDLWIWCIVDILINSSRLEIYINFKLPRYLLYLQEIEIWV